MKIEFENSVEKLSILSRIKDISISWKSSKFFQIFKILMENS